MEKKQTLTVGELKEILKLWLDDTPVAVSVDSKSKPCNVKRTGTLITNRHADPNILTAGVGLFLWSDD